MRIRSTKPEFWRSERIARVDWDARLVLKGLESYVDDNGVGKDDLALIVGDLFQRDLVREPSRTLARVSEAISRLCEAGLVWRYAADGTDLIYLAFWESVQRVDKPQAGRFPRPDGTMNYKDSQIRESVANVREGSRALAPGTGEQGNRGTGFESPSDSLAHLAARDTDAHEKPKRTKRTTGEAYTAEFEQWWSVYPNKRDKHAASVKFPAARKLVSLDVLIAAARRYATDVDGKDVEHIKYGKTWLHQRSWKDYADSTSPSAGPLTAEAAREWLLAEHSAGRTKQIEIRTGLRYPRPDLPDDVSGREAAEQWAVEHARQWITANNKTIIERLIARTAS